MPKANVRTHSARNQEHALLSRRASKSTPPLRPAPPFTRPDPATPTIPAADPRHIDDIGTYLNEIGRVPRLSLDEEVTCARLVQVGQQAARDLQANDLLAPERRRVLHHQVVEGMTARNTLVEANLRLVVTFAKAYQGRGLSLLDLIQEGNLGLLHAAERFQYQRGHRFSTYAVWWIRQSIVYGLAQQGRSLRVPTNQYAHFVRATRLTHQLEQVLGRDPMVEEVAQAMGPDWTADGIQDLMAMNMPVASLDAPLANNEEHDLGTLLPHPAPGPEERATARQLREHLHVLLEQLTPRESIIVRLRFGLDDGEEHTLEAIGSRFNLTRERIRQIEKNALSKLRSCAAAAPLAQHLHS